MKTKHFLIGGLATLSLIVVSSCTDSSYDLNNVDTTARFQANKLTVPINLNALTFSQVLDLDENSEIKKEVVDGKEIYVVKKEGTFNSSEINVDKITAHPSIGSSSAVLSQTGTLPGGLTAEFAIIGVAPTIFTANATDIDESIKEIDTLGVNSTLKTTITLTASGSIAWASAVTIKGLKIEFPAGMKCTTTQGKFIETNPTMKDYSLLDLSTVDLKPNSSGKIEITLNITDYYTVTKSDNTQNIDFDPLAGTLTISDQVKIQSGTIELYNAGGSFPSSINFNIAPTMDDLVVETFTGKVNYKVKDFNIDPIDLSNLPDFLNQEGTKLGLENPQIYLGLNNPVGNFHLQTYGPNDYVYLQSTFKMTPQREDKNGNLHIGSDYVLDPPGIFEVPGGTTAEQLFVMAPTDPKPKYYQGFNNPSGLPFTYVKYTGLKDVLQDPVVDGIPTKIEVKAEPELPAQDVSKFTLGTDLGKVEGRYTFYSPLQLSAGTQICYNDTVDGWNDEDVDAMTITNLTITMEVTSDVSFPVALQIQPIGLDAKPIGKKSDPETIKALAQGQKIQIVLDGSVTPFKHLDGIILEARIINSDPNAILNPNMELKLKNSKATITGYYEKEL